MNLVFEISVGSQVYAATFSANGEYLLSGGEGGVQVWRVEDGKQMATMEAKDVRCLAVSNDGRCIAAGTHRDGVFVWDAQTYEKILSRRLDPYVYGVDFSPDSTRLVTGSKKAVVWDIATGKLVHTLDHDDWVRAAKYSPQGDRVATATRDSVRVWDSNDGSSLMDIKVTVTPLFNTGLLWFSNHLLVVSDSKIKQIEASSGSSVSEWPVPGSTSISCIALPKHGGFIAYSAPGTVTFWDTATRTQLGLIRHAQDIRSVALSLDHRFLAIVGEGAKIIISSLSRITVSTLFRCTGASQQLSCPTIFPWDPTPLSRLHPTFQEPYIRIDDATLRSWKHNQFRNAEALLTAAIDEARNPSHDTLVSRALVRAHLRQWDTAIADAAEVFVPLLPHALSLI